jgi:poly-gamma-glutamate synthesis protein (capsule biosynthesis protein)
LLSVVTLAACGHPAGHRLAHVAAASPSAAAPITSFTLVATGDFISQPDLSQKSVQDGGFGQIMAALKPIVSTADVAICHMETPLAAPGDPWTGYPIFNAPPSLLDEAKELGYDSCSTASNHTIDYGWEGLVRTLDGLDRVGIKHAGSYRTELDAHTPNILDVHGVKLAHLSYTFSFNGLNLPEGKPWCANLIDPQAILAEARRAKAAGADLVAVSMHWGTEYVHDADVGQLGLARELLASPDIDLILGTHVHVVQPIEKIGSKWVLYGMGNVLVRFPDGSPEETQDATITRFTFTKDAGAWQVSKVEVVPTWTEYYPSPRIVDLAKELSRSDIAESRRATYQRAYDRIVRWVNDRGAGRDGLTVLKGS